MNMVIDIIVVCLAILFLIAYFRQLKNENVSKKLYNFLNTNIDIFKEIDRKRYISDIKNSIDIYSKFQIIQKISKSDYVTLFKYNYSEKIVQLDFLFSIDNNGRVVKNSVFDDVSNILTKNKNINLCELDVSGADVKCQDIIKNYNLNKIYYKNILDENDTDKKSPIAFMLISYVDGDIEKYDIAEINRILKDNPIKFKKNVNKNDYTIEKQKRKDKYNLYLSFLFVFIFLLFMCSIFYTNSHNPPDKIFNTYFYNHDIPAGVTRGNSNVNIYSIGIQKFYDGDYLEAFNNFEKSIENGEKHGLLFFYAGLSAMFSDKPDIALEYFSQYNIDSALFEDAEWYKVGCYLLKNDVNEAKLILKKISEDPDNSYNRKAFDILKNNNYFF